MLKKTFSLIFTALIIINISGCGKIDLSASDINKDEMNAFKPVTQAQTSEDITNSSEPETQGGEGESETETVEKNYVVDDGFIEADAGIAYDITNKKLVYSKNLNEKMYPASMTKLLTALVAIENCDEDFVFTAGSELGYVADDASVAGLEEGDQLKLREILVSLLIPSGNDSAYTIAVNVARKVSDKQLTDSEAVQYFGTMMNEYAISLGATSSNFVVPDGYHNDFHYTTAYDMLQISIAASRNEIISDIVSQTNSEIYLEDGAYAEWTNGNPLISDTNLRYEINGLKTGYTDEAEFCFSGLAEKDGAEVIVIVFHCDPTKRRYEDALKLFDLSFDIYDPRLPPREYSGGVYTDEDE